MDRFTVPLLEGNYYHVYNRANNREKLFYHEDNYGYFLNKFKEYLSEFVELYSFCLIPNHFHLLIKVIKEDSDLNMRLVTISKAFSDFFNSYSKSINKQENRYGNLFQRPFKRIYISEDNLLLKVVCYIHQNPIHHGLCKELEEYKWSSYFFITHKIEGVVNETEVLNWFGGLNEFLDLHKNIVNDYKENYVME